MAIVTFTKRPDLTANGQELVYKRSFLSKLRGTNFLEQDKFVLAYPLFQTAYSASDVQGNMAAIPLASLVNLVLRDPAIFFQNIIPLMPMRKVIQVDLVDARVGPTQEPGFGSGGRLQNIRFEGLTSNDFPTVNGVKTAPFLAQAIHTIPMFATDDLPAEQYQPRSFLSPAKNYMEAGANWNVNMGHLNVNVPFGYADTLFAPDFYDPEPYVTLRITGYTRGHVMVPQGAQIQYVDWIEQQYPDLVDVGTAQLILRGTGRESAANDLEGLYNDLFRDFLITAAVGIGLTQ